MPRTPLRALPIVALALALGGTADFAAAKQAGRALTGRSAEPRDAAHRASPTAHVGEAGLPYPAETRTRPSKLDERARARARSLRPGEKLRVIVFLDHAPNARIRDTALLAEQAEIDALRRDTRALLRTQASDRGGPGPRDADDFSALRARAARDRPAMRALAARHEHVSLRLRDRISSDLRAALEPARKPIVRALEALGAEVEFATLAGNAIIVRVPSEQIDAVAAIAGVARVAADELEEGHLNNADAATLVNASGGLWANGETGGTFDPAIIDSGADRTNPLLVDQPGYENFWLWYLVSASGYWLWADALDEDDRQGHGTHVQGIVASHGSTGNPNHLGMAYGVEKVVNLKAGFCCGSTGGALMYGSDRMQVVDRALYSSATISSAGGAGTFGDDVDGMNLSYGGATTSDETDASRFIDAVVHTYPDLPFTISAGNDGPSNTNFSSPATAYNAITVANVDDRNSAARSDDRIAISSTRGPTASGRRKPDIAAPGTSIQSPNYDWEGGPDVVSKTGTSMAAPMVLGVAMDLMDAGVTDELEIKALLINTAQKNEPSINFESDSDGWDPRFGWGYMNTESAYYHRADVRTASVTERPNAGHFKLYAGSMEDEGASGEGRDRATIVWSRHASHNGAAFPTAYSALSDLNLRLYDEGNGAQIDADLSAIDNVQQVRIGASAGPIDVVVKVYAWSTDFPHGGTTESFALATEEGFAEVPFPDDFQGLAIWPSSVEPNEQFDVEFWLRNDSDVAAQTNAFDLSLPAGFVLNAGADPYAAGTIAGSGGLSSHVVGR